MTEKWTLQWQIPRIGSGIWQMVVGACGMALGLFMSTGAAVSPGLGAAAVFVMLVSAGLIAAGFWCRLFHLLEKRLVDVGGAIRGTPQVVSTAKPVDSEF